MTCETEKILSQIESLCPGLSNGLCLQLGSGMVFFINLLQFDNLIQLYDPVT